MKNKSLVALAVTSLLSVSFAYAAPAETMIPGDDAINAEATAASTSQTPAMDNLGNGSGAMSEMDPTATSASSIKSDSLTTPSTGGQMEASNTNDDISADTATGDDDF